MVFHELTLIYKLDTAIDREVYDIQGPMELDAEASLFNPNNLALYACGR